MSEAIVRFAAAIGYPDAIDAGILQTQLIVDDTPVSVRVESGRLILTEVLWRDDPAEPEQRARVLPELASYAAGRILREEATLAWDEAHAEVILWQDFPAAAEPDRLRRFFEVFLTSCDWWRERVADMLEEPPVFPDMIIRP